MSTQPIIYGPISSRRLGQSLGINILGPQKVCSFDCPYCDLGPSEVRMNQIKRNEIALPTPDQVEVEVREALANAPLKGTEFSHLTISGQGEPTLHPDLLEIAERVVKARNEMAADKKIVILSNGAHLDQKKTISAMNLLDERILKLDAGNDRLFKLINAPLVRTNVTKVYAGYRKLKDVIVQSFFVGGVASNTKAEDIEDWIEIIGIIQPKMVQICGINRPTAIPGVERVDEDTLYTIASKLKRRTQIESAVFF